MNNNQPIFMQIMEIIENDIILGEYKENDLIISTTQISKLYNVNPTTSVKAIAKLVDAGILHKDRGIGMRVSQGARAQIMARRKEAFLGSAIIEFIAEAERLGISAEEIIELIKKKSKGDEK